MSWKILLISLTFLIFYLYIQNYWPQIRPYQVALSSEDDALAGKKVVFISDTHLRENTSLIFIDRVLIQIEEQAPDLILFGGDIVHKLESDRVLEHVKDFFFQLSKVAPTYVIYGNHDLATHRVSEIKSMLDLVGVHLLDNEAVWITFQETKTGFWLMGLKSPIAQVRQADNPLGKIKFKGPKKEGVKLLLAHHPEAFSNYLKDEEKRPQLILAGHSHVGQVILPILGGLFVPGQGFLPPYDFGLFSSQDYPKSRMLVTRGLGNSRFPFRINNRPEIIVIDFR